MDYSARLRQIQSHLDNGHFSAATLEAGRVLESLLRELYGRVLPVVGADQRELFNSVERRVGGGKAVADFGLGQLIGLFREAHVWDALGKRGEVSLRRFRPDGLKSFVDLRNDVAHGAAEPSREATAFLVAQLTLLLSETNGVTMPTVGRRRRAVVVSAVIAAGTIVFAVAVISMMRTSRVEEPTTNTPAMTDSPRLNDDAPRPLARPVANVPTRQSSDASVPETPRVAVLYFDNGSTSRRLDPLKTGLTDMITTDLISTGTLRVVEREKLNAVLRELRLQQGAAIDPATAQRLGKVLGAEYLMMGAFFELMDDLRIDCKVVRVETGEVVSAYGVNGKAHEFMNLEKSLVAKMTYSLVPDHVGQPAATPAKSYPAVSFATVLKYSRAIEAFDAGDRTKAKESLASIQDFGPAAALQRRLDSSAPKL